jgi:hypothetical protein
MLYKYCILFLIELLKKLLTRSGYVNDPSNSRPFLMARLQFPYPHYLSVYTVQFLINRSARITNETITERVGKGVGKNIGYRTLTEQN